MRVTLLPAGPDPFLLAYWFRNFAVWADEVDELHVLVCGQSDPYAIAYIRSFEGPKVQIRFHEARMDHGQAMELLMDTTEAEYVLFMEDDAYVRRPGEIELRFQRLEAGTDVIGGPRGNASMVIIDMAQGRFGSPWQAELTGEAGHALWPCFLFARRSVLLATDQHYGARGWQTGEYVDGLDFIADQPLSADTFGSTTYQLRANGARIEVEGQYRITNTTQMGEWIGRAPWFHVGSLSTGYGIVIGDDSGGIADTNQSGGDWARRVSWWQRFARTADALPDHLAHYRAGIATFMADAGISQSEVDTWSNAYQAWITWQELP